MAATFSSFSNIEEAESFTFDKAAPGQTSPAVFIIGKVNSARDLLHPPNQGRAWNGINDDRRQCGSFVDAIPVIHTLRAVYTWTLQVSGTPGLAQCH